MTSTLDNSTTIDAFLGGRLTLEQPARGYRAGVDPVLLAASVPARPGHRVLELGCGTGAALLCLAARVPDLDLYGLELQAHYADLCRANAARNSVDAKVFTADLRRLPAEVSAMSFDQVFANPPYFDRSTGSPSDDESRDVAFGGETALADWIDTATRRLKPKGYLTLIQKAHRLQDVLGAMDGRLGSVVVVPINGRDGKDADRILVQARKGGRAQLRLCAPVSLHQGPEHLRDEDDYQPKIRAVLRDGAAFPI